MKFKNKYLDILAEDHDQILVFDCEFWHVYGSEGYIPLQKLPNEFFMPREIGGFFLTRSADKQWIYKDSFFVTLSPPKGKDVSFVSSAFANVTDETADKLDEFQSVLTVPWSSAYLRVLPEEIKEVLLDGIDTYNKDKNIKKAHKPTSWLKGFIEEYSNSLVIVKGNADIESLQNACRFHDLEYKPPKKVYDIAEWNLTSRKKCGTAKLDGTYECIYPYLDDETKKLTLHLPMKKAHEPSSDAAMTLIVALYIKSLTKR
jgi:hypothetical protein